MIRNVKPSSVYVISSKNGTVKVGRSIDPQKRCAVLSAMTGEKLVVVSSTEIRHDASVVEATAHKLLSAKRRSGEWFDVSHVEAVSAVRIAISIVEGRRLPPRGPRVASITFEADQRVLAALDDIRSMRRPVPTISEAIRQAILNERDALRRKMQRSAGS